MKKFRIAVLDRRGEVMEEVVVKALGIAPAVNMVAYGPESRIRVLIRQGEHEVSIVREDVLEEAMKDPEHVDNLVEDAGPGARNLGPVPARRASDAEKPEPGSHRNLRVPAGARF